MANDAVSRGKGSGAFPGAETPVSFPLASSSGRLALEGMLGWPEGAKEDGLARAETEVGSGPRGAIVRGGVIVAHPHPLHGATMDQPVVYRVAQACRRRGLATLRFNFRGVGRSEGCYSGTDEDQDVCAALSFFATCEGLPAGLPIGLAGYSFGSMMAARAAAVSSVPVQALVLVTFPVCWPEMPADTLARLSLFKGPVLALCAEKDDVAPPSEVDRVLSRLGLDYRLEVLEGVGHFLEGRYREIGEKAAAFFEDHLLRIL